MDSIMNDTSSGEDYFDPTDNWSGLTPKGEYKAHVLEVVLKENHESKSRKQPSNKNTSTIYEISYRIAPENAKETFKDEDGKDVEGLSLVDRTIKGRRIYKFKTPTDMQIDKGFVANPSGNYGFRNFLHALGMPLTKKIITQHGVEKEVEILPDISKDDILGKPVIISVRQRVWKDREGKEIIIESTGKPGVSAEVFECLPWTDGEVDESLAIPF